MREILLIVATAAAFIVCGWAVRKVGEFLEKRGRPSSGTGLCIGVSDPALAEEMSVRLRRYTVQHPNVTVSFLCGTEEELLEALARGKVDVAFLPDGVETADTAGLRQKRLLCAGPEGQAEVWQRALWNSPAGRRTVAVLLPYLRAAY